MELKTNEILSILISISLISNEPKKLLEIKTLVKSVTFKSVNLIMFTFAKDYKSVRHPQSALAMIR